jgi:hypothetical protein
LPAKLDGIPTARNRKISKRHRFYLFHPKQQNWDKFLSALAFLQANQKQTNLNFSPIFALNFNPTNQPTTYPSLRYHSTPTTLSLNLNLSLPLPTYTYLHLYTRVRERALHQAGKLVEAGLLLNWIA